jgi:ubiquinone/menaquinone biosynthesis C-methylase UbiE
MMEKYNLPRDTEETARLAEQHHWLHDVIGCLVHPAIPLTNPKLRIADVATGSAIWLLDIAKELPMDCQLHGFDISTRQYPPTESRPPNLFLHQQDILKPFPQEYHGFFDIIAIRLVTAGLRDDDWDKSVENLSILLKPGGYIQWLDADHSMKEIYNNKAGTANAMARELTKLIANVYAKTFYPGPLRLPELFEKNGLKNVALELYSTDKIPKWRTWNTSMSLATHGNMVKSLIVKDPESDITAERFDEIMKKALDEIKGGDIYTHSELNLVVAQKPEK